MKISSLKPKNKYLVVCFTSIVWFVTVVRGFIIAFLLFSGLLDCEMV